MEDKSCQEAANTTPRKDVDDGSKEAGLAISGEGTGQNRHVDDGSKEAGLAIESE